MAKARPYLWRRFQKGHHLYCNVFIMLFIYFHLLSTRQPFAMSLLSMRCMSRNGICRGFAFEYGKFPRSLWDRTALSGPKCQHLYSNPSTCDDKDHLKQSYLCGFAFFHLAVFDHENAAGVCNGGKPVGDHKNGLATAHIGKCGLDFGFIIRVRKSSVPRPKSG